MINYNKNKLINKTLDKYYETFSHMLDTADFVPDKFNDKIGKYIFKNMKKAFKQIDKEDREFQRKFRKELNNTAGYVDKLAKEMEKGLGGSIRLLISSFQEVQLAIGEALYDTFGPILPKIATALKNVANFIKANKKLVATIVAGIAILGALGVAFFALG